MKKIIYITAVFVSWMSLLTSCSKDFTETKFFQEEQAKPLTSVEQLSSFVRGTYVKMRSSGYLGNRYRAYGEIRSDEMYNTFQVDRFSDATNYTLTSSNADPQLTWKAIYEVIANANIVINASENLSWGESSDQTTVSKEVKRLKGQAYAIRALAFFDLLRLYGQKYSGGTLGVVLPINYDSNVNQPRATIVETEVQIERDFQAALDNIGITNNVANKTEISSWAVKGLMSRYYLYKGDLNKVAELVKDIVDSGKYAVIPSVDLVNSFQKENTPNSIFEIKLGLNGALGVNAYEYLFNSGGYSQIAVLKDTEALYETDDARKKLIFTKTSGRGDFEGFFLNGKFPSLKGDTNLKILRYEEILLNGIEANITSDNAKALEYYNLIRENRGLAKATSVTLEDVKKERILELLGEGFRYWDLLRWGSVIPYYNSNGIEDTSKNRNVGDPLLAFPIPQKETDVPGSLVKANPGYDNYRN